MPLLFSANTQAAAGLKKSVIMKDRDRVTRHVIEWDGTSESGSALIALLDAIGVDGASCKITSTSAEFRVGGASLYPGWTFLIDGAGFSIVPPRSMLTVEELS